MLFTSWSFLYFTVFNSIIYIPHWGFNIISPYVLVANHFPSYHPPICTSFPSPFYFSPKQTIRDTWNLQYIQSVPLLFIGSCKAALMRFFLRALEFPPLTRFTEFKVQSCSAISVQSITNVVSSMDRNYFPHSSHLFEFHCSTAHCHSSIYLFHNYICMDEEWPQRLDALLL